MVELKATDGTTIKSWTDAEMVAAWGAELGTHYAKRRGIKDATVWKNGELIFTIDEGNETLH